MDNSPKNYSQWKNPSYEVFHTVRFYLFNILEMTNDGDGEQLSDCQWLSLGNGRGHHRGTGGFFSHKNILLLDCINVKIWLWYYPKVLQNITIGGSWVKDTLHLLCLFLQQMWIYTYLKIKSLINEKRWPLKNLNYQQ